MDRPRATLRTFGVILVLWGGLLCSVPFAFGPAAPALDTLERMPGRVIELRPVQPTRASEADLDVDLLTEQGLVTVRAGFCQTALAGLEAGQPLTVWRHPYAGVGDVRWRVWQAESRSETLCAYDEAAGAARRGDWTTLLGGVAMIGLGVAGLVVSRIRPERRGRRPR